MMWIEKPIRIKDADAVNKARYTWCEWCGITWMNPSQIHVHHVKTRGAGGSDVPDNLVSLCYVHHQALHIGRIDRREFLDFIAARNEIRRRNGGVCVTCGSNILLYSKSQKTFSCGKCQRAAA